MHSRCSEPPATAALKKLKIMEIPAVHANIHPHLHSQPNSDSHRVGAARLAVCTRLTQTCYQGRKLLPRERTREGDKTRVLVSKLALPMVSLS